MFTNGSDVIYHSRIITDNTCTVQFNSFYDTETANNYNNEKYIHTFESSLLANSFFNYS